MKAPRRLTIQIDAQGNLPVYAQIREQITWLMAGGQLEAGARLPTIRELARQLKINLHTVRRAYHALEADGLLETRPGRGTKVLPMHFARLISKTERRASHIIGVLLPNVTPFYASLMLGLEEEASRLGYVPVTCYGHDNIAEFRRLAQQLASANVDGLIAVAAGDSIDPAEIRGLPAVCVDAPQIGTNSLVFSLESSGHQATRHLIGHGHRRIALITAPLSSPNNREAARGYRRALREAHLVPDPSLTFEAAGFLREFGYGAAKEVFKLTKPPTAVFVSGDVLALGAIQAFKEAGKRIPEDIAIVSKDNSEFSSYLDPPLTTVAFPTFEAGVESMKMLHGIMTGGSMHGRRTLPGAHLVIRRSCGCEGTAP